MLRLATDLNEGCRIVKYGIKRPALPPLSPPQVGRAPTADHLNVFLSRLREQGWNLEPTVRRIRECGGNVDPQLQGKLSVEEMRIRSYRVS